jgi:hypothetical protein
MNNNIKVALGVAGAFVLYKFYKLYELGESLILQIDSAKFVDLGISTSGNITSASIDFVLNIKNSTKESLPLRGIEGYVAYQGRKLASFSTGAFTIKGGDNKITLRANFSAPDTMKLLQNAIKLRVPKFEVVIKKKLPYFTTTDKQSINVDDLIPANYKSLIQYLRTL